MAVVETQTTTSKECRAQITNCNSNVDRSGLQDMYSVMEGRNPQTSFTAKIHFTVYLQLI